jgi:hydroxymethylpyrimidine/phosphomethylpyrimidine kinase
MPGRPFVALTVAGSDSGGGAGIQADLKTFASFGVFGTSAITAVTAQNTVAVEGVFEVSPGIVRLQIEVVSSDIGIDAAKTGMLFSAAIVEVVAETLDRQGIDKLVVDPVMVSKSGARLLEPSAVEALRSVLVPRALLVTPNLPEAETLVGFPLESESDARRAAERLVEMGARGALIKGGHALGEESVDLLYYQGRFSEYRARRVATSSTHGTGCTFSAAIAAGLARGEGLESSVSAAKRYLTDALQSGIAIGRGHGSVDHFVGCTLRAPRARRD